MYAAAAAVVFITLGSMPRAYTRSSGECFLLGGPAGNYAVWALLGPILLVCSLNTVLFVRVVRKIVSEPVGK